jgi:hypothetical protein
MEFKVKRFSNFGKYKISEVYLPKFLIKRTILKVKRKRNTRLMYSENITGFKTRLMVSVRLKIIMRKIEKNGEEVPDNRKGFIK